MEKNSKKSTNKNNTIKNEYEMGAKPAAKEKKVEEVSKPQAPKTRKKTSEAPLEAAPAVNPNNFYDDEEVSNTEVIEIKKTNKRKKVTVIDSETSSVLEQLKNQEVANKPKPVSSEEQDKVMLIQA